MSPNGGPRRRRPAQGLAVVLLLVVVSLGLVWGAVSLAPRGGPEDPSVGADGSDGSHGSDGTGQTGGEATGDPGEATTPPASGWAAMTPATIDAPHDLAGSPAQVAQTTLDALVERAPVVVTVDKTAGPLARAAADLAASLAAPLLLVGQPDDAGTGATSSPTAPPTGTLSIDPTGQLEAWGTAHVVAVGAPPATDATVHRVELADEPDSATTSPAPSSAATGAAASEEPTTGAPSESASGQPSGSASAQPSGSASAQPSGSASGQPSESASGGPSGGETAATLVLPEQVQAMQQDAAASPAPRSDVTLVVRADDAGPRWRADVAATATMLGIEPVAWNTDDPRRDGDLRAGLADTTNAFVLAVADGDRPSDATSTLQDVVHAATAPELPGGGLVLFPDRVFVATYGNPVGPALGVLGERDVAESIAYTKDLAAQYDGLFGQDVQVQPAFEIITTIASANPEDGDYSRREDLDLITEWVDEATDAGLYVMLDLQPGRTDFLTQAKEIEQLLLRPNVGLALDPEWRLEPHEVHLEQIGSVTTAEVNEVSAWLAELVREHNLPQKLLIVHNFRLDMLTDRQDLVNHRELAEMIHVDGQGAQAAKDDTYGTITAAGPDFLAWGWKNFFDEDVPGIRSPEDTAAVKPQPNFISYQ